MANKTISQDELSQKMQKNENIQLVNVLAPEYYHLGMIKGSLKIPVKELDNRYTELDAKQEIITYCAGPSCNASREAAEKLAAKGFQVRAYEGGLEKWKEAGLPFENESHVEALEQPSGLSGMAKSSSR